MKEKFILFLLLMNVSVFSQENKTDTFIVTNAAKKLKTFERKYIQFQETKDGKIFFQSILTRKLEKITSDKGQEQFLHIQTYQSQNSIDQDSSFCDANTLMPISYFTDIRSEGHKEKVFFNSSSILNTIILKDSSNTFSKQNKNYYNGVVADDIISIMPLKENGSFIIKAVNPGKRYFEYAITVTVEGKEETEIPVAGKILCWKLKVNMGNGDSIQWYSVKDRVQIKQQFSLRDGSSFNRYLLMVQ